MRYRGHAFTIIELLAAIAVAGLLMVAVMQAVGSLGRTATLVNSSINAGQGWKPIFENQLERDLAHVEKVQYKDGKLKLRTLGAYDPETLAWQYVPSKVVYYITEQNGLKSLVRDQSVLVDGHSRDVFKQVVVIGVEAWSVKLDDTKHSEQFAGIHIALKIKGHDKPLKVTAEMSVVSGGADL